MPKAKREQHGMRKSIEYATWCSMIDRCERPKNKSYARYGGRGIKVCEGWRNSFLSFYETMGPRPAESTLDRFPNRDGNYEPGNCRWATRKEQNRNYSRNQFILYKGERKTLIELAENSGIPYKTVWIRLNGLGWTIQDALERPLISPQQSGRAGGIGRWQVRNQE